MLKTLQTIVLFSILFFAILITISFYSAYKDVKEISVMAKNVIGKECVPSLMDYFKSVYCIPAHKTRVIWALGQLADKSALDFLYETYAQYGCTKNTDLHAEAFELCYETLKSIKQCSSSNMTHWMFKNCNKW